MTHEDIVESVAYERGINKYKTNYSREDLITAHTNQIIINWVEEHHPDIIKEVRKLVEDNINE